MALTTGALNVQSFLQRLVPPPFLINPKTLEITKNPNTQNKWLKLTKTLLIFSIFYHLVFAILRLLWINFKTIKPENLFQNFMYFLVLSMTAIALNSYTVLENSESEIRFLLKQEIKLLPARTSKNLELKSLFIYIFAMIFLAFPIFVTSFPFYLDFDPLQLVIISVFPYFYGYPCFKCGTKIIASFIYASTTFYGAQLVLNVMLVATIDLEIMQYYTLKLFSNSTAIDTTYNATLSQFKICRWRFNTTQILIKIANEIFSEFLFVLATFGIGLGAVCGYAAISLYDVLPAASYYATPCILGICVTYDFLHFPLAAVPNRNGARFIFFWKKKIFGKMEKLQLRACPRIGYSFGPIRMLSKSTALAVADCILNWTVDLALINEFDVMQLVIISVFPSYYAYPCFKYGTKIIASLIYATTTLYGVQLVLTVMFVATIDLDGMQYYTSKLFGKLTAVVPSDNATLSHFEGCRWCFNITQILINVSNDIFSEFLFVLVTFGMGMGAFSGYATISLHNVLPAASYYATPCILGIIVTYDFLHFPLAAVPNRNGAKFVFFWKTKMFRKIEKLQLRACPRIGYSLGPIRRLSKSTTFAIADCILNWTVNLALINISMTAIALNSYTVQETSALEIQFLLRERFKLVPVKSLKNLELKALFIYTFAMIFLAFPILVTPLSFYLEFDPLQLLIISVFSSFYDYPSFKYGTKIIASLIYGTTTFYGAQLVLTVMFVAMLDLDGMQYYTSKLFGNSNDNAILSHFKICRLRFNITQILIKVTNDIFSEYLFVLVTFGMGMGAFSGYAAISLYDVLPTASYYATPLILGICVTYDFLHVPLAAVPNRNGARFVFFWKTKLFRKMEKLQLRACPRIGYSFGPIRMLSKSTALEIADCILNWTVDLALINSN
ncbi:unnamed protein product [Orchesella dallaii]|uniref:Uncharacterized protein n=1 Tax=Orchesella dallaii TaxID=48710 RepID=A0ABP1RJR0_9HEXA